MMIDLPDPVVRSDTAVDTRAVERDLRSEVDGEVRFDAGSLGAYAVDSSNFRQVPIGVVLPRTVEAGVAAVAVCHRYGAPLLSRGGGTSLAGQCCNHGVVIDWSKYCTRVVSVDPHAQRCVVEPGIARDPLNRQLSQYGLSFGPKPATHVSCTVGGMLGNNSCGSTAQAFGKAVDNVAALEVLTYDGHRMWVGPTSEEEYRRIRAAGGRGAQIYAGLHELAERYAEQIRARYPRIPRRVSGYNLDALLPEHGFDLAAALVGTESTVVTVLRAELKLVHEPEHSALVVLGYPDVVSTARAVPSVNVHQPHAVEGVDAVLVNFEHDESLNQQALRQLPEGSAWLLVEFRADDQETARGRCAELVEDLRGGEHEPSVHTFRDPAHEEQLWAVREAGLGATARDPRNGRENWEGWEDAAVPPDALADYLGDFRDLLEKFGYADTSALYGHFGHGCVHTRIPFELTSAEGVANYRAFMERAADLVVAYGGSLSGEHGDGQSRGELLDRMFGADLVRAFSQFKAIFDPGNKMNPGKVVAPYRLDENLRLGTGYAPAEPVTHFRYPHDEGRFSKAALRCVGVGKCRRDSGGVMCPSYMVTREERHSTRGRARLLWEMLQGDGPVRDGWRSTKVRDALDLCLACKGCKSDCPVGVDMATYKAEFLAHHYARRIRPMAHYSMGWLPALARPASWMPGLVNALSHARFTARPAKRLGGIAEERELPRFARPRFSTFYRRRGPRGSGRDGEVVLWPDTFTEFFSPWIAAAAVRVLEDAGFRVRLPERAGCCGLTWISTGQLGIARRVLNRTVRTLAPAVRAGTPVVVLEPSCAAVFTSDATELLAGEDVLRLGEQTFTLGQFLETHAAQWTPGGKASPLDSTRTMIQQHCHQHATAGYSSELDLLHRLGARTELLDSGCCGLAGNFGFERGHYDISMAAAERALLPAVRDDPDSTVLADGFSCRTQIQHGADRRATHLAEVLDSSLPAEALPW